MQRVSSGLGVAGSDLGLQAQEHVVVHGSRYRGHHELQHLAFLQPNKARAGPRWSAPRGHQTLHHIEHLGGNAAGGGGIFCHSLSPGPSSPVDALLKADTLPPPGATHNPASPSIVPSMSCPPIVPRLPAPGVPQPPKLGGQGRAGNNQAAPARSVAPPCAGGSGTDPWPRCTWGTRGYSRGSRPPAQDPLPNHPGPLIQHSLGIQGTTDVAVTWTAAEQVVAQPPVARLRDKRLLRAQNRLPSLPSRESDDDSQPLHSLGKAWSPDHWLPPSASHPGSGPKPSAPTQGGMDTTPQPCALRTSAELRPPSSHTRQRLQPWPVTRRLQKQAPLLRSQGVPPGTVPRGSH